MVSGRVHVALQMDDMPTHSEHPAPPDSATLSLEPQPEGKYLCVPEMSHLVRALCQLETPALED